jgi:EAL domain-containing protein (putative c-di-GMP-specific phosphodiesterase class I)
VAEGVENEQQADFLRSVGCDVAQGFALAHPQDPEAITQLLIESECA